MVNLGKLAKSVKKVVDTKGDKIAAGVDKATDFVDKKTKGKFHDKLEKVDGMAQKLDKTKAEEPVVGTPPVETVAEAEAAAREPTAGGAADDEGEGAGTGERPPVG